MENRITGLVDPIEPATTAHADADDTIDPAQLDAILNDYHVADLPLTELGARHDIPITQLLDILDAPRIAALLDRIARGSQLQAARIAAAAQPLAVNRLRTLIATDPADSRVMPPTIAARHRETTRKAAAQIVGLANRGLQIRARSASEEPSPRVPLDNVQCRAPCDTTRHNSVSLRHRGNEARDIPRRTESPASSGPPTPTTTPTSISTRRSAKARRGSMYTSSMLTARVSVLFAAGLLMAFSGCANPPTASDGASARGDLAAQTAAWHAERVEKLTAPDGWLTLVALEWLRPGSNTVGRAEDAQIRYAGFQSDLVGTIGVREGSITFEAAEGVEVDGVPAGGVLRTDTDGAPTVLAVGDIRFYVIVRGGELAVRIKDAAAPTRTGFEGIERYPVDAGWRVAAEFVPETRTIGVDTVIGKREEVPIIGRARFEVADTRFDVVLFEGDEQGCYFMFGDATNGDTTFPGGRYLYVDLPPENGKVVLDFNRAYNPPCRFTPFATCTIPLPSNRFPMRVTAGER